MHQPSAQRRAHASNSCSTWVDDELAARGLDVPAEELPGCCATEQRREAAAAWLLERLEEADPTQAAVRLRAAAAPRVAPLPAPLSGEESEGEEDAALLALRRLRLKQLRSAADAARAASALGYREVSEAALGELAAGACALVVHLPLPGFAASAEMDEALAERARAAGVQSDARFVRMVPAAGGGAALGAAAAALLGAGGAPLRPPALALLRNGHAPILLRGLGTLCAQGELDERLLERWLAVGGVGAGPDGFSSEEEADAPPCASCGRTYPHQHVRALRTSDAVPAGESDGE